MTTGHVFIAASLDGYIARSDGDIDWLMKQPDVGEDHGYDAFMATVDGLVMGRNTFEKVLTFGEWPYDKPVVVMSRALGADQIPGNLKNRVRISARSPAALMAELDAAGWSRAYVDGGALIQSFLREGLIADITLTHIPILIGGGLPLFGELESDVDLEHISTRSFDSGFVTSFYRVRREDPAHSSAS